jgi:peptide/nickel transport system substrate-binding protein
MSEVDHHPPDLGGQPSLHLLGRNSEKLFIGVMFRNMWASMRAQFCHESTRIVFAIAVGFVLIACLLPTSTAVKAAGSGRATLTWGMMEPIDSLNPFVGVNDNAYIFYGLVYDYLIAVDENLTPKPNLALSWGIVGSEVPYGSVWEYNLTHNAIWHDNEPFTADDVVFTIDYQIGAHYDSMWAYQPYTILIKSAEKIDDYTVRIHFQDTNGNPAPCPFGDKLMMPIVPKHIWEPITSGFSYENFHPIGTGPFMCTENTKDEFIEGSALVLEKNPDYHAKADFGKEVQFDRLILKFYLEPTAMITDLETGKIDMGLFSAPQYKNLLDYMAVHPDAPIGTSYGLTCTGYSVDLEVSVKEDAGNGTNPCRLDPAVRQAMAYATDKQFIKDNIYMGYAQIGSTIISPIYGDDIYWEPNTTQIYNFDLAKANATLDAAGYAWNDAHTIRVAGPDNAYGPNKPLEFTVVVEEEIAEDKDTAMFLTDEWAMVGIKLNTLIVSTAQWNVIVYGYNYDLTISYWSGDPDPNYLLFIETSYAIGGWSENAYSNPAYDEAYTKCIENVNITDRIPFMKECQEMMYRDCAFMVTVYPYGCYAYRTDHFSGWGDMQAHPGRSLSNFWTANPLYFELTPIAHETRSLTPILIGLAVVFVAIAAVALFLRMRGGSKSKEEDVRLP